MGIVPVAPLSIDQAAEYLGVNVRFMRRLIAERKIRHYKVGKLIRFAVADLDTFLRAGVRGGAVSERRAPAEGPVTTQEPATAKQPGSSSSLAPYGDAARLYYDAGWRGVVPVEGKSRPLPGYTGSSGQDTSWPDVFTWVSDPKTARLNIALRLPADVIGIDVDAYEGRNGARTRAALERLWGALPPTYTSTSRTDGASGIRFYRVAADLTWPANLDEFTDGPSHVDIIRRSHRYAVVAPSIHPTTGAVYRWTGPDGGPVDKPPGPGDLPVLPHAWVRGITGGQASSSATGDVFDGPERKHAGPIAEGTRHDTLVSYAGWLRDKGLPLAEAQTLMLRRLEDCAQPPEASHPMRKGEALAIVRDVYGRYAAGAPEEPGGSSSSWDPVDLTSVLDGTYEPLQPRIMARSDGQCLLYRGRATPFTASLRAERASSSRPSRRGC